MYLVIRLWRLIVRFLYSTWGPWGAAAGVLIAAAVIGGPWIYYRGKNSGASPRQVVRELPGNLLAMVVGLAIVLGSVALLLGVVAAVLYAASGS